MKKFAIALVALMFLLVVACGDERATGASHEETTTVAQDESRFIIRHNDTGVCYLFVKSGYSGAMVRMYNPDGSPYVWEED